MVLLVTSSLLVHSFIIVYSCQAVYGPVLACYDDVLNTTTRLSTHRQTFVDD